ncbi:protein EFR3 [Cordyceps fumosorosea ARSEF 2679]|uniref:Protein EFR3 n=1 Tax=Cordyceps fumosorosea (strain ARSEF 2679) TaxID=1081104 RepID=A0A167SWC3_CORFA|nr:protein EFR3 [Cordyceps fumosorosea ARSEF 2679]OAA59996.1 protein EFR3 [Cordyceps fumosorosea ARSEF 2679]
MNALENKLRPKHQVLVLKCYPRITKGAVDVKPNSSELSYLLFYATSRRSKIQKIGAFLEKKTSSDVWRMRIGNVQVTLAILAALLEKSPKEATLIAPTVLKILNLILGSNDITMIESSIPTFEAFCETHDPSSLFGDGDYLTHYRAVIRSYAELASNKYHADKPAVTRSVQIRWRNVGLSAIKCVSAADALSSLSGRQISVIVPVILDNLWSDNDNFLDVIYDRLKAEEKYDAEKTVRRRTSIATVRTNEEPADASPLAISGTGADVDNMAEEETGVLALQCLKSIYVAPNRSQIHTATTALLNFIIQRAAAGERVITHDHVNNVDAGPCIQIFNIISRWAPVQDRYIILLVTLDTMGTAVLKEDTLEQHIVYTAIISSILRSDLNLIGLSVMDVLHGLIRQMRKVFQLRSGSNRSGSGSDEQLDNPHATRDSLRANLLNRLESCIGDLAHHIYYADQVWDMITAILVRLKPTNASSTASPPHAERPNTLENGESHAAITPEPGSAETTQNSQNDQYLSYTSGRASALRAIKAILVVANPQKKVAGDMSLSRSRVPIQVWEETQWLLQDPNGSVRKAYVDALLIWLDRETVPQDCNADDDFESPVSPSKNTDILPSRRSVSHNAHREKPLKNHHVSHFLPMLHLAVYDSALQLVDFDSDMCLLHALLSKLAAKLGVNAARYGLPMIFRLQEEIQEVELPIQKVRIAALCHGYFWSITDKFQLENSNVGRAIHNEIKRRQQTQFWIEGITIPPKPLYEIGVLGRAGQDPAWDMKAVETGELLPFDDRISLVESIASAYQDSVQSPPSSPAASPNGRQQAPPFGSSMQSISETERDSELPTNYRQQLLADWSRDGTIATIAAQRRAESLAGSKKTGNTTNHGNRLTINTAGGINGAHNGTVLPASPYGSLHNLRPHSAQPQMVVDRFGSLNKMRKTSIRSANAPSPSPSQQREKGGAIASVDQLKMMLSGNVSPRAAGIPGAANPDSDDSGDSMVSYDYTMSELSFNPATGQPDSTNSPAGQDLFRRNASVSSRGAAPSTSHTDRSTTIFYSGDADDVDDVPPVPPLPNIAAYSSKQPGGLVGHDASPKSMKRSASGRVDTCRQRNGSHGATSAPRGPMDLQDLLRGIDSTSDEGNLGNLTRPPY